MTQHVKPQTGTTGIDAVHVLLHVLQMHFEANWPICGTALECLTEKYIKSDHIMMNCMCLTRVSVPELHSCVLCVPVSYSWTQHVSYDHRYKAAMVQLILQYYTVVPL